MGAEGGGGKGRRRRRKGKRKRNKDAFDASERRRDEDWDERGRRLVGESRATRFGRVEMELIQKREEAGSARRTQ